MIRLLDTGMFESIILQYNLLDTANEPVIAHANAEGIGVIVMGPLGGGRLAAPSAPLMAMIDRPVESTTELALRFVLSNPLVSSALSGMGSVEMVEENAATASVDSPLTADEKRRLLLALEEKKRLSDLYCTGCEYCMPCPSGVNIPRVFELVNYHRLYGLEAYSKEQYRRLETRGVEDHDPPSWAEACAQCGECEEKCPQDIDIVRQMMEAGSLLGGP
jgi:predicted aldo/keto reductase-like oxidoreductase